jgi:uncharacterized protein RhaS with RHS repeats
LQRWLNRDIIGERGGFNLYRYVLNNPIGLIDVLGLFDSNLGCEWCLPPDNSLSLDSSLSNADSSNNFADMSKNIETQQQIDSENILNNNMTWQSYFKAPCLANIIQNNLINNLNASYNNSVAEYDQFMKSFNGNPALAIEGASMQLFNLILPNPIMKYGSQVYLDTAASSEETWDGVGDSILNATENGLNDYGRELGNETFKNINSD